MVYLNTRGYQKFKCYVSVQRIVMVYQLPISLPLRPVAVSVQRIVMVYLKSPVLI